MIVADYIVERLIEYEVTDTFGIPGGVILRLLYSMEKYKPKIVPHLNYHEQMAGFAACGYAQMSGKLGVAYATRGPGITNMVTCIAEAYQEALPVLFITAHASSTETGKIRFEYNQELDIVNTVSDFVKYGAKIDKLDDLQVCVNNALLSAMDGRKGPVILDVASNLFEKELIVKENNNEVRMDEKTYQSCDYIFSKMQKLLNSAERPIILIGDGVRGTASQIELIALADKLKIPIVSSRASQDLVVSSKYYFGYIGSHGTRYSNFILIKADLIIAVGNRLAFPAKSKSYASIVENKTIIRIDIDKNEFYRKMDKVINFHIDAKKLIMHLSFVKKLNYNFEDWVITCNVLKNKLNKCDMLETTKKICSFIEKQQDNSTYVCDVGNNEFLFARAFEYMQKINQVLYTKSYGTLGVAIGRAIGAYYASRKDIVCIIGDQGFQYNIQELNYIQKWKLPIKIILLNNCKSGMIMDHEYGICGNKLIHVDHESGYFVPDFENIVNSYGIEYTDDEQVATKKRTIVFEIKSDKTERLIPTLPKGNLPQDMEPKLDKELYEFLEHL